MRPQCCLPQRINNFFRKKESFMNIFVGFCFFSNEIFLDEGHLKVERTDLRGLAPVTLYIIHINVFNALSSIHEKAAYFQYCFPQGTPRPRACRRHFLQLSHFQDTENQVCFFKFASAYILLNSVFVHLMQGHIHLLPHFRNTEDPICFPFPLLVKPLENNFCVFVILYFCISGTRNCGRSTATEGGRLRRRITTRATRECFSMDRLYPGGWVGVKHV